MILFNGFEEILMTVIKETHHFHDQGDNDRPYKTDEARFDAAMKAIFGDHYTEQFKQTADLTTPELLAIKKHVKDGMKFRAAVRKIVEHRLSKVKNKTDKAGRAKRDDELNKFEAQARKHFKRNADHYADFVPLDKKMENYPYRDYVEDDIAKREKIFEALRQAGWPI